MDGTVVIKADLDTKSFDKQIAVLERQLDDYVSDLEQMSSEEGFNEQSQEVLNLRANIEKLTNKLGKLKEKQDELDKQGLSKWKDSLNSIGNSTEGIIKKVTRWGLAIFGVRSAYMFIRQSMSTLSQYDNKLATDLEYIRWTLTTALKSVIEAIVNLAYRLISYVIYIGKEWGLISKNANFSAKAFQKANKSLKDSNKNAKSLSKTLTGFDEMNILQENGTVSTGGGGGGLPTQDLASLSNMKPPKWLEWIVKNKKDILRILAAIAGIFITIKNGYGLVKGLGIGIAIAGIIQAIQKIIDFINDPTFDNFIGILEGIALAVTGVAIAVGAWPVAFAGAIAFVVVEIVKNYDKIKEIFDNLIKWLDTNILGGLRKLFGPVGDIIYMPFKIAIDTIKIMFESFYGGVKKIIDGIVKMAKGDLVGGIKLAVSGLADILTAPFKTMWNTVKTIFTTLLNFVIDTINTMIDGINVLPFVDIGHIPRIGENKSAISGGRAKGGIFYPSLLPKLALGGIINNPGPGVPYHGATIGERGAEAVVPLTDSQQMSLLGEAIGRHVTINATIPVYAYNREVDRQIQIIRAEDDFAFNR